MSCKPLLILEVGTLLHPQCPLCNMMVPLWYLNGFHKRTAHFKKRAEQKRWKLVVEESRAVTSRAFRVYGRPLEMVPSFKYLGRVLLKAEDDFPLVVQNLAGVRTVWRRMSRVLSREGARPRLSGFFFKAVVQSVLLFGAET